MLVRGGLVTGIAFAGLLLGTRSPALAQKKPAPPPIDDPGDLLPIDEPPAGVRPAEPSIAYQEGGELVADAGEPGLVRPKNAIELDGRLSTAPVGTTFVWRQLSGPALPDNRRPICRSLSCAVILEAEGAYTFELELRHGSRSDTDRVSYVVAAPPSFQLGHCQSLDKRPANRCRVELVTGRKLHLRGSVIDTLDGDPEIRWRVENWRPGVTLLGADSAEATFEAQQPGYYTVIVSYRVRREVGEMVFWDRGEERTTIQVRLPGLTAYFMLPLFLPHGDGSPTPYTMPTLGYHVNGGKEGRRIGSRIALSFGTIPLSSSSPEPDLVGAMDLTIALIDWPGIHLAPYVGWHLARRDEAGTEHGPNAGIQTIAMPYKKWVVVLDWGYRYSFGEVDFGRVRLGIGIGRTLL